MSEQRLSLSSCDLIKPLQTILRTRASFLASSVSHIPNSLDDDGDVHS